jgi:hypothetical protein
MAARGDTRINSTSYEHPQERNLLDLHTALQYRYLTGEPELRVNLGPNAFVISGNVLIPGIVQVFSDPDNPIHNHTTEVGTSGNLQVPWLPIAGNVRLDAGTNLIGNVSITQMPGIRGNVNVDNFPSNIRITDMPGITGNVNTTITDVITVVVNDDAGEIFSLNNHATNVHRGWMMDDVMRPVISIRLNPDTTTSATLMKIIEYEIGNNNANQSTIMYEWYEGDLTIAGAAIPDWSTVHDTAATQYRVYQDRYSSNQGNTFTHPSAVMRHSGIIIGKNTEGDGIAKPLTGGATGKTWTLCMKRLDNGTELDVWFAFTFKELT